MTDKNEKLNPAELADEELNTVSGGSDEDLPESTIEFYDPNHSSPSPAPHNDPKLRPEFR